MDGRPPVRLGAPDRVHLAGERGPHRSHDDAGRHLAPAQARHERGPEARRDERELGLVLGGGVRYLVPVVALVLGAVVRGETVAALAVLGTALVVAGAYLGGRGRARPAPRPRRDVARSRR